MSHFCYTETLPPLALKAILNHVDSPLHTLYFIPAGQKLRHLVFDSSTIAVVNDSYKQVRDLGISIRRTWNIPGEGIAVLKTISRLPYLSSLELTFDASDYTLLFHSNSPNEPKNLAPSNPPLSAFDAEIFSGGFGTSNYSITKIVEDVGKEWIVERSSPKDGLEVRRAQTDDEEMELPESLGQDVDPIFRRIWPGDGNWFNG